MLCLQTLSGINPPKQLAAVATSKPIMRCWTGGSIFTL